MASSKVDRRTIYQQQVNQQKQLKQERIDALHDLASASSDAPAAPAKPGTLFILRHGERLDEADSRRWHKECQIEAKTPPLRHIDHVWADPPLTADGVAQAEAACATMVKLLQRHAAEKGLPPIDKIYCSKLRRAAQTAVPLARALGLPIYFSSGLSASSAYLQQVHRHYQFLSMAQLQEIVGSDVVTVDADEALQMPGVGHWYPPLHFLARREETVLVVAHREALRDLANVRFHTPYCCMGEFAYLPELDSFLLKQLSDMDGKPLEFPKVRPFSPLIYHLKILSFI